MNLIIQMKNLFVLIVKAMRARKKGNITIPDLLFIATSNQMKKQMKKTIKCKQITNSSRNNMFGIFSNYLHIFSLISNLFVFFW